VTRVSVLVPTHDHARTLPFAVHSVLAQTMGDLEVLIIGDGVGDDLRTVAHDLEAADPRVRFLDLPKGPHHGELHRHDAIQQSSGEIIAYLCDDDLFLPDHLADLVGLLETHDFVQSLNGCIDSDGEMVVYPGDLADPEFVRRVCDPTGGFNFVSITGTAHTRDFYERVDEPWHTTPSGEFPDQHQWGRMLSAGGARAATSRRMTSVQFPGHHAGRASWDDDRRVAEIRSWADAVAAPDGQHRVDALVRDALWTQLVAATRRDLHHRDRAKRPLWKRVLAYAARQVGGRDR
jgi:hypothetical protein